MNNDYKPVYLIPNLSTTASLFFAFFSIILTVNGNYPMASAMVFISMIFDGLDGRIARMLDAQSEFGAEYDSLVDIVAFGVAPALLIYKSYLFNFGTFGWILSFIYLASVGLRLARFNIQNSVDKRYFTGLPCPSAAAVVSSIVWMFEDFGFNNSYFGFFIIALFTFYVSAMMVGNLKFRSFKDLDMKNYTNFKSCVIIVVIIALLALKPSFVLFITFGGYALSGAYIWFRSR